MNLHSKLLEREAAGRPVSVGLIGAGKFGTMFLSQARLTRGMHVAGVADLDVARARSAARDRRLAGGADTRRPRSATRMKPRATFVTDDAAALIADPAHRGDRRGDRRSPAPASSTAWRRSRTASTSSWSTSRPTRWRGRCWRASAKAAGVVYSLAWGDQPALICEHVDWARACGFKVVAPARARATSRTTTSPIPTTSGTSSTST